jgi:hypothetical protein
MEYQPAFLNHLTIVSQQYQPITYVFLQSKKWQGQCKFSILRDGGFQNAEQFPGLQATDTIDLLSS